MHGTRVAYFEDLSDRGTVIDMRQIVGPDYHNPTGALEIFWDDGHVTPAIAGMYLWLPGEEVLTYEQCCMAITANALAYAAEEFSYFEGEDMHKEGKYQLVFGQYVLDSARNYVYCGWHILRNGVSIGGYPTYKQAEQNGRGLV